MTKLKKKFPLVINLTLFENLFLNIRIMLYSMHLTLKQTSLKFS